MILRVVLLFLLFIAIMGMIQKWLNPRRGRLTTLDRLRCPTCKRVNISNNPAPCQRPDCRYR